MTCFIFEKNKIKTTGCSVAGMFVMFTGLYFVLWAKGKEGYMTDDATDAFAIASEFEFDAEKPLLS